MGPKANDVDLCYEIQILSSIGRLAVACFLSKLNEWLAHFWEKPRGDNFLPEFIQVLNGRFECRFLSPVSGMVNEFKQ